MSRLLHDVLEAVAKFEPLIRERQANGISVAEAKGGYRGMPLDSSRRRPSRLGSRWTQGCRSPVWLERRRSVDRRSTMPSARGAYAEAPEVG